MSEIGWIAGISVVAVLLFLLVHLALFLRHIRRSASSSTSSSARTTGAERSSSSTGHPGDAGGVPEVPAAQRGVRAFMRGDYQQAFELLEPVAQGGNLKAQQLLAKMYFAGHGVEQNREQYLYWLQRCAENGDKPARAKLKKLGATSS